MKFKKMLAVVSALGMLCTVPFLPEAVQESAVITAKADKTYNNITYFVTYDKTVTVTGYVSGTTFGTDIVIPSEIQEMPVTAIEEKAFYGKSITSISIPDSVSFIGDSAFYMCNGLQKIIIPEAVTSIGKQTFCNSGLITVTIPDSVTSIGDSAFFGCKLTAVTIPDSVTSIGSRAFSMCKLEAVTIPESVTAIKADAFQSNKDLSTVIIKNPECVIGASSGTLGSADRTVIVGYANSTAQAYAEKNGYRFELLEGEQEVKAGDADGSGEVDILDVISINKAILGKENLSENGLKAIDFNGNKKPDSDEAMKVLKFIVGLIEDFNA